VRTILLIFLTTFLGCKTSNTAPLKSQQHLLPIANEHLDCVTDDPDDCIAFCVCCHQCHWEPCKIFHSPPCHLDQELLEELEVRIEEAQVTREPTSLTELYRTYRLQVMQYRKEALEQQKQLAATPPLPETRQ